MRRMNERPQQIRRWLLPVIALLALAACGKGDEPINIAGNAWLGYQPLYLAYDHARSLPHDGEGLGRVARAFNITMLSSTSAVIRALKNGMLDGALLTLDEAIRQKAQTGMDLCVAMVLDYSDGADALVAKPEAFSERGRRKLRIGYEATALGGYMLSRLLQYMDWRLDDIEPVNVEPDEQVAAFRDGRVDAVIAFEPYLGALQALGGKVFFSSRDIPDEIIDLLVVKRAVWQQRQADFDRLATVLWPAGLERLRRGAPGDLARIAADTGLDRAALARALRGIHLVGAAENRRILARELGEAIAMMTANLIEAGLIDRSPALASCD